jgi:hypothetical protein
MNILMLQESSEISRSGQNEKDTRICDDFYRKFYDRLNDTPVNIIFHDNSHYPIPRFLLQLQLVKQLNFYLQIQQAQGSGAVLLTIH